MKARLLCVTDRVACRPCPAHRLRRVHHPPKTELHLASRSLDIAIQPDDIIMVMSIIYNGRVFSPAPTLAEAALAFLGDEAG